MQSDRRISAILPVTRQPLSDGASVKKSSGGIIKHRLAAGISVAALTMLLAMPDPARADQECGPPEQGQIVCHASDDHYPDGIHYDNDQPGSDLFLILDPGVRIVTSGQTGIHVDNLSGSAVVDATGTAITTDGENAGGIWALSYSGSANVHAGSVRTIGDHSAGIIAVGTFVASVDADTVVTEGYESYGISVLARDLAARVGVNAVTTDGDNSTGIALAAETSDPALPFGSGIVELDAGTVTTFGNGSKGITFETGEPSGRSTIAVDEVSTSGNDATGIEGTGFGASTIVAGKVTTLGDNSAAIASYKEFGNEDITAGTIETRGADSDGILTVSAYGNSEIAVQSVATAGDDSFGIYQENLNGTVGLTVGKTSTGGSNANGVTSFSTFNTVKATIGSVETSGTASLGVFLAGGKGVEASIGNVLTRSGDSAGVQLITGSAGNSVPLIRGGIAVEIATVETMGNNAAGVLSNAFGDVDLAVGEITTSGDGSVGLNSIQHDIGDHVVKVGKVVTQGDFAEGVLAVQDALRPGGTMTVSLGDISTSGDSSSAARFEERLSAAAIAVDGNITTSGAASHGIEFSYARAGTVAVADDGAIKTSGAGAHGIGMSTLGAAITIDARAIATSGDDASAIHIDAVDEHLVEEESSAFSVTAGTLVTSGRNAHGIDISLRETETGGEVGGQIAPDEPAGPVPPEEIFVRTKAVAVSGAESIGIRIATIENARIEAGDTISEQAAAIDVDARGSADLSIAGRTKGGQDAVLVTGSDVTVTLAKSANIVAAGNALVLTANGPFIPDPEEGDGEGGIGPSAFAGTGMATVENAGAIQSETGDAIRVLGGAATIANSGSISGGLALADGDDRFTNSGAFDVTRDSDFGAGTDLFVNSGILRIRPGAVTLFGLERFENVGGLIDLRNGAAGDMLTLPGTYVGSADATLAVDIAKDRADRLVIGGVATGSTRIIVNARNGEDATLLAAPVAFVTVGAGSAADAFTIANGETGFIQYGLDYDAATRSFALTARAGAPVYRLAKLQEAVQALSLKAGEAWSSHTADMRDTAAGPRLWGQMFGGVETREGSRSSGGGNTAYDLETQQDFFGAQLGYDLVQPENGSGFHAGLTGGYIGSKTKFHAAAERAKFDAANVAAYGGVRSGPLFANALAKYDHYWVKLWDPTLDWSGSVRGHGYGLSGEMGIRFGNEILFAEPVAALAWQRGSIGDLEALGQKIAFDDADGLRGRIGARLGGSLTLGKTRVLFYGGGNYAHEFAGEDGLVLRSNGIAEAISNRRLADRGEAVMGLRIGASSSRISGFLQGTVTFGSAVRGSGGRAGIRIGL